MQSISVALAAMQVGRTNEMSTQESGGLSCDVMSGESEGAVAAEWGPRKSRSPNPRERVRFLGSINGQ